VGSLALVDSAGRVADGVTFPVTSGLE
jgi:hypothetical protein